MRGCPKLVISASGTKETVRNVPLIVAEIRRSRFLVADFTSDIIDLTREGSIRKQALARGGVYYEAGFAQ
jgi:hypothetical protein